MTVVLLAVGVQVALLVNPTLHMPAMYASLATLVLACIPGVNERIFRLIQRARHVTPRTRAITTAAVFVVAFAYLTFTAHRQKRAKAFTGSTLDDVPGIGPGRKRALLMHFGTARAVRNAALQDLEKAPGISVSVARKVYDYFHPSG